MFTRVKLSAINLAGDWARDGPTVTRWISEYLHSLQSKGALAIDADSRGSSFNVRNDFGAVGDGTKDDYPALNAAVTAANATGRALYFPTGIYKFATTLVLKNKVRYYGDGKDQANAKGSVLKYTGTSDAIQINNPIDSSTAANVIIEDLAIQCTTETAGKACIADVGSTYLRIRNVAFSGNDKLLILDQSEIVLVDECDFEGEPTCGIWIVNGDDHTSGADAFYTNHITLYKNQFNLTSGIGVIDDGGAYHRIIDNNFNACTNHIRVTSVNSLTIAMNAFEQASGTHIDFKRTKHGGAASGACTTVNLSDNFHSNTAAINCETYAANAIDNLNRNCNHYNNANVSGAPYTGINGGVVNNYHGFGNQQYGTGSAQAGNNYGVKTTYTPTATMTGFALGNGGLTGEYTRNGATCTATVNLAVGTTTNMGTVGGNNVKFSLPFTSSGANISPGSWYGTAAGNPVGGTVWMGAADTSMGLHAVGVGGIGFVTVGSYAWANGDAVNMSATYPISPVAGL